MTYARRSFDRRRRRAPVILRPQNPRASSRAQRQPAFAPSVCAEGRVMLRTSAAEARHGDADMVLHARSQNARLRVHVYA